MSQTAKRTKPPAEKRCGIIRLSGGRILRWIMKPRRRISHLLASLLAAVLPSLANNVLALDRNALPTDGSIKVGSGSLGVSGNQMTVLQNSGRLGIDWQSFNIGADARVNFVQPGRDSIALNRVVGNNGSEIFGRLSANGQVFLTNPNGVLFAPGARVDVGGLVASTFDLSQDDFAAARYTFAGNGGTVLNQGELTASAGGYVALFGGQVSNEGQIDVRAGSVVLAAGRAITVEVASGGLLSAAIAPATTATAVANSGMIGAEGGNVRLDARAAQGIAESLINNSGVIRATSLESRNGEIWLTGAAQITNSGTLDASSDDQGAGGRIVVKADMERGTATIAGQLLARGGRQSGDGGFIETSGAHMKIANGTTVDTTAPRGKTGQWLIDPTDFTIAASGGDIDGATLSANLSSGNVTLQTSAAGGGNGDLFVNDAVSWGADTLLTLEAHRNININADIEASGNAAGLTLTPAIAGQGDYKLGGGAKITLSGTAPNLNIAGQSYTVINDIDALQGMSVLAGNYALGSDVDASATAGWNSGAGFLPVGNWPNTFTGTFDGLGHTITGLVVNAAGDAGLFGDINGANILNVGLVGGSVTGDGYVGALAGSSRNSIIRNVYATGSVTNNYYWGETGGLVGETWNNTIISNSHATGNVTGGEMVGGLVGLSLDSNISDSHATGTVTGDAGGWYLGGLVGESWNSTITNSYATGNVTGERYVGGLVGSNYGTIAASHAAGSVVGNDNYTGGLVGYNADAITDSFATGSVSAGDSNQNGTGGLVGGNYGIVSSSHAIGNVSAGANSENVGGLVGSNFGTITNSHYDIDTSLVNGESLVGRYGLYDAQFQDWVSGGRSLNIANYTSTLPYDGASGSYGIGSLDGLKNLLGFSETAGLKFQLTADFDLSALPGFNVPIFSAQQLDGGAHSVANAVLNRPSVTTLGFIGSLASGSTVSNLNLTGVSVTGKGNVGGLVGSNAGTLTNVSASGAVMGSADNVGGLVGYNTGTINGSSSASAGVSGTNYVGGLVGKSDFGTISNAYATGAVSGAANVGGLTGGNASASTINDTYATGTVFGASAGGLAGSNTGTISNSHATGAVSGTDTGGLVGLNMWGTISDAYATGTVSGTDNVGGLVGLNQWGTISNAYAIGAVSGTDNVGGLVGFNYFSTISDVYATGAVSGNDRVAGLVGNSLSGTISNVYATGPASGRFYVGGLLGDSTVVAISNAYATGAVSGSGSYVGGLIGNSSNDSIISAHATGSVSGGINSDYVGGLVGHSTSTVSASYARGTVIGNANLNVGPLFGSNVGSITNSHYDIDISLVNGESLVERYGLYDAQFQDWVGGGRSLSIANYTSTLPYDGASGTYGIGSLDGLKNLLGFSETAGLKFRLTTDLDLSALPGFNVPVFLAEHLDGAGHTVANLVLDRPGAGTLGFIGSLASGSTVSNLALTGVSVTGKDNVGGLVGSSSGMVSNVSVSGSVTGTGDHIGGLVGSNSGTINGSSSASVVVGGEDVGGLVGTNWSGTISNSYATGAVSGYYSVGGLVGQNESDVADSYALGTVSGAYAGPLIGYNSGTVTNSHYDIDNGLVNGGLNVAPFGLYGGQFQDWLNNGKSLNIASYASTLPFDNISGAYSIGSLDGLKNLLGFAETSGLKFRLTTDLDLSAVPGFHLPSFSALQFDGAGHTLTNLAVNRPDSTDVGFIGWLAAGSSVSNLTLTNVSVTGDENVGGLVGTSAGTISNSSVSGSVTGGNDSVGGLVGYNSGTISNVHSTAAVFGDSEVGGLVGYSDSGTISEAYATGAVSGDRNVGGLVGLSDSDTLSNVYATGAVSGDTSVGGLIGYLYGHLSDAYATGAVVGGGQVGGLVGELDYSTINNVHATGAVSGEDDVGGLVGISYGSTISNAHATGAVSGDGWGIGGLIGESYDDTISGTYATGRVDGGANGDSVGGLAGYLSSDLSDSYSTGVVRGKPGGLVGGLMGDGYAYSIDNSHYDIDLALVNSQPEVGPGGLYHIQFDDWLSSGKSALNTANYASSLAYDSGSDTYGVGSLEGLKNLLGFADSSSLKFRLTSDFDLSDLPGFYLPTFSAQLLDGGGHTISNLTLSRPGASNLGFIGSLGSASTVSNLTLANVSVSGRDYVGALVGSSAGAISNAHATGTVTGTGYGAGGLVGYVSNGSGTISNTSAAVTVSGYDYVGGLVGQSGSAAISNSYATGDVSGNRYVGGLVGSGSTISNSYATGNVSGTEYNIGGLAGASGSGSISNSYAIGNVSGRQAGGLVGYTLYTAISNSYASGAVSGTDWLGGLIGYNQYATFSNSYWDTTTSGQWSSAGGTGKTTGQLMTQAAYSGWDFANVWWSSEGNTRPFLRSEWNSTVANSHQLQLMAMNREANYSLANDIDLTTALAGVGGQYAGMWGASGFVPIGRNAIPFTGQFDGNSHVITGLNINRPTTSNVGLFGVIGVAGSVANLGLDAVNVSGQNNVGGLAGTASGSVANSFVSGAIAGSGNTGGLVGSNAGSITNAYAAGTVSGNGGIAGGLVGANSGTLDRTYSEVIATGSSAGGLVGANTGTVSASYWNTDLTVSSAAGGGLTDATMKQQASFDGWDFASAWRIYEDHTRPLLKSFLTPLTVTAGDVEKVYDKQSYTGTIGASYSDPDAVGSLQGSLSLASSGQDAINAGTYTIVPSGLWSDRQRGYDINYVAGTLTISPRQISVTGISAEDKVYDGTTTATINAASAQLSGVLEGDDVVVGGAITGATFADKNVGTGKAVSVSGLSLGGSGAANYFISGSTNATGNITPLALTMTGTTVADKEYDRTSGAGVSLGTLSGLVGTETVAASATATFDNRNAGVEKTVTVTYSLADGSNGGLASNYSLVIDSMTANIFAKTLSIASLTASDKEYDRTTVANVSGNLSGVIAGDTVNLTGLTGDFDSKNVGAGKTVTVSGGALAGADAGNYQVGAASGSTTAAITAKTLNIASLAASDKEYDRTTVASVSGNLSGVIAGDTVNLTGLTGDFDSKNVGAGKTVTVSGGTLAGADAGNYTVGAASGSTTAAITAKTLSIASLTASDKEYDRTTVASVSGNLSGVIAGDAVNLTGLTGDFDSKNVGAGKTVTVSGGTLAGADAGNYTVGAASGSTTAAITAKTLSIASLAASDKEYDRSTVASVSGNLSGVIAGDTVSLSGLTGDFDSKNVGTGKTVTVSGGTLAGADAGNYQVGAASGSATAAIIAKTLSIASLAASDKEYDRTTVASVSGNLSGVIAGDTVNLTGLTGDFDSKNVGAGKTVTVSGGTLAGADAGNYLVGAASGSTTAAITAKTLSIASLTASDKEYDRTTVASVSGNLSGVIAGDAVNLTGLTGDFDSKNVGVGKTVTVSGGTLAGADAGNYTVGAASGSTTATITAKTLSIASLAASDKEYDRTTVASVSGNLSGVIAGDAVILSGLTGDFDSKNVGAGKTVTVSGGGLSGTDAGNYLVGPVSGSTTAAIIAKTLSIAGLAASDKAYDRTTNATVSGTLSGVIAGDTVSLTGLSGSFDNKNVGIDRTVTVSGGSLGGADAGNYQVGPASGSTTADITAKILSIAGLAASDKEYDRTIDAAVSGTLAGVISGDTVNLTGLAGSFDNKNVGTGRTVTVSGGSLSGADAGNYLFGPASGSTTATITARNLGVAAVTANDKVYDGTTVADVSSGTLSGVITGDDVRLAGLAGNFDTANVGADQTVTVSGGSLSGVDAGNYVISGVAGFTTASITARPLTIAANTVVRLSGESEPIPFGYSVPSGGLVNGETLGPVTITAPDNSATAGTVATLTPSGAVFGVGAASNYNISYANGYLIVLPNPAANGGQEGEAALNPVLLVQINEDELKQAGGELGKQQTVLLARRDGAIDPVPGFEVKPIAGQFDLEEIRQFAQRNQRLVGENSAKVIDDLRRQPVILWHPELPEQLFKVSLSGSTN